MAATIRQSFADSSTGLRRAIQADAIISAASALGLLAAAGPLASLSGLPALALEITGALFLPYAAWMWYVASRPTVNRRIGWTLAILNTIWVLDSILLLSGWLPLTDAGWWLIVAQAVVVAALADWQFLALYKTR